MFERINDLINELQTSYESKSIANIVDSHSRVVKKGLELLVESDALFKDSNPLTSIWSDIGTEGAAALLKAVELADRYDMDAKILSRIYRVFLLNLSAIENYRCGRHGITAAVMRREASKVLEAYTTTPTGRIVTLLRNFCIGNLSETWSLCVTMKKDIIEELSNLDEKSSGSESITVQLLLSLSSVIELLLILRTHLETGNEIPGIKEKWLTNVVKFSQNSGDSEYLLFAESFVRTFRSLEKLSIWNIKNIYLSNNQTDNTFVSWTKHRIESGKPFMFPSQYEALISHRSLLHDQELVTMPTGGGKTLIAEVFILLSLIISPKGKCLYVVPTRALASEKREDLGKAFSWANSTFSVCQMTGDITFDVETALIRNNVIILTPEKFDILMRNSFYGHKICAMVIDEFHTIKASYRGIKLQLSIKRFQENYRSAVLYISAILRNSDIASISRWVRSADPFSTEWRPTPARIGLVSINNRPKTVVSFNDGTFREITDLDGIRVDASNKVGIRIVKTFLETEQDQVLHFNLWWRPYKSGENHLIQLANEYLKEFKEGFTFNAKRLSELSLRFTRLVGEGDPLEVAFRKGIAIHWSELPLVARNIEETAIRDKAIGLILSTSTLAEGVNLPIKTIFMPKLSTRRRPLEKGLFLNVIGRAGRPYFHPEGQVIIAFNEAGKILDRTPKSRAQEYASTTSSEIEPIITSIVETGNTLDEMMRIDGIWTANNLEPNPDWEMKASDYQRRAFRRALAEVEALSSNLLACIVEKLISDVRLDLLENIIFLGPESPEQRELVKSLLELVRKRFYELGILRKVGTSAKVTPWGKVVYMTGLGPISCQRLKAFVLDVIPGLAGIKLNGIDLMKDGSRSNSFAKVLLKSIHLPLERYVFGDGEFRAKDEELLLLWTAGMPLEEISRQDFELDSNYLKTLMRFEGALSVYASWVFYSLFLISESEFGKPLGVRSISKLAEYSLYGHFDSDVLRLLGGDINKTLLRDDLITLKGEMPQLKGLFENKYDADYLRNLLEKGKHKTRIEEKEVALALMRLVSQENHNGN